MAKAKPQVAILPDHAHMQAAAVMARAFAEDPVYHYLLPHEKHYQRRLEWMMRFMLRICARQGVAYQIGDPIQGVAAWLKPGETVSFFDEITAGVITAPLYLGATSAWRSNAIMAATRKNRTRLSAGRDYWYLWQFAVAPESRGKGYGRALLQPVLDAADASGTDCWLDNSNAANLPVYHALGFTSIEEYKIQHKQKAITIWHMRRPAQKPKKKRNR